MCEQSNQHFGVQFRYEEHTWSCFHTKVGNYNNQQKVVMFRNPFQIFFDKSNAFFNWFKYACGEVLRYEKTIDIQVINQMSILFRTKSNLGSLKHTWKKNHYFYSLLMTTWRFSLFFPLLENCFPLLLMETLYATSW